MKTTIREGLEIITFQEKHKTEVRKLLIDSFSSQEPLTKTLGITSKEMIPLVDKSIEIALKDEISVICIKDNEIVACSIATDICSYSMLTPENCSDKFNPIFALLGDLFSNSWGGNINLKPKKIAYCFLTATKKGEVGRFLNTILNKHGLLFAIEKGYEYAYAEFTNPASEIFMKRLLGDNIKQLNSIKLDKFVIDNQKAFKDLKHYASSYIMTVNPSNNINDYTKHYAN